MTFTNFASQGGGPSTEVDIPAQQLDVNFQNVNTVSQCTIQAGSSANLLILAATANQPPITNPITDQQRLSFTATSNSTGAVQVKVNGVTYNTSIAPIVAGQTYDIQFLQALNSGAGGFQLAGASLVAGLLASNAAITGTWTAPTAAGGTNNTQIATTAFATSIANTAVANGLASIRGFGIVGSYALLANDAWIPGAPCVGGTGTPPGFSGTWMNMGSFTFFLSCSTFTTWLVLRIA